MFSDENSTLALTADNFCWLIYFYIEILSFNCDFFFEFVFYCSDAFDMNFIFNNNQFTIAIFLRKRYW